MVDQLDFQQLPGANEIACHLDVGLGRGAFAARVVVLCNAPSYVQLPIVWADIDSGIKAKGVLCQIANHSGRPRRPRRFAS